MSYRHILVAVAVTPESQQLLAKAVSIAQPVNARISLITLASDPELYNQFAAPMLEDLRAVMHEETHDFLKKLGKDAGYPIAQTFITYGELSEHILDVCRKHDVDLVVCGNHNQSFFSRASCSAKSVVSSSLVDVLLVPLDGE
ncbi:MULTISPECIES: universal stress protein UspC [Citrobacter]|uniref:universal stress protein UspC n=1 Tax=Citrobacter TaxID=544 RepID=UPI0015EAE1D1|nr:MULTISPECIES: universal stress protein UspC [Citrobacter]EHG7583756.1 universal stress protein UspC [Citrobacter sedlakii]EIQ7159869.1 universal stress protein UspC [Citrobacter sedlakii]MBN6598400.1 universal stress protein UspC [Citrobacter sedlakii]QMK45757.1 universal stress protein UspC [Citrobacter sp. RHB21-C05]QMK64200.1 universal stress protein UspC [Citrobacter sp. RHB21-C01]